MMRITRHALTVFTFAWLPMAAATAHSAGAGTAPVQPGQLDTATAPDAAQGKPLGIALPVEMRTCEWKARWIWTGGTNPVNAYMCARKEFTYQPPAKSASLHISADQRYRLFLNDRLIGYGPPQTAGKRIYYDSYNITRELKPGVNVVAVEAYSGVRPRGGLICQIECGDSGKGSIVATDETWKVKRCDARRTDSERCGTEGWYSEIFDLRKDPIGWRRAGFDDSAWERPALPGAPALMEPEKTSRTDYGYNAEGRLLQASVMPFLLVADKLPKTIVKAGEVTEVEWRRNTETNIGLKMAKELELPADITTIAGLQALLAPSSDPAVVDNHEVTTVNEYNHYWTQHGRYPVVRHASLTLDFGEIMNGRLSLEVEGNEGAIMDVAWAPMLIDGRVHSNPHSGSSHADRYFLRRGRQTIESYNWHHFRYVRLTFRDLNRPLKLFRVIAKELSYPFERVGKFDCSDPMLTRIWNSCAKTMDRSTVDSFYCDMYREVSIYGADPANGILCVFSCFGNPPVVTQYLDMLSKHKDDNGFYIGVMLERFGSHPLREAHSYEQAQHLAARVADTLFYWNDTQQIELLYEPLMEYIRANKKFLNEHGVLENARLGFMGSFLDWGGGHAAPGAVSLHQNLLFYELVTKTAAIARHHKKTADAEYLDALVKPILGYLYDHFWDGKRNVYVNNVLKDNQYTKEDSTYITEQANYTALLFGLGKNGRQDKIMKVMESDPDNLAQVEPSYTLIPMQALFHIGESGRALHFMRERFSRAYINGFDTFPEEWSPLASIRTKSRLVGRLRGVAYSSASVPAYVLSTEVLGLKSTEPGFGCFQVKPHHGDLKWAEGVVPTPKGNMRVRWEIADNEYLLTLDLPSDAPGEVFLPQGKQCTINGQAARPTREEGLHQVHAIAQRGRYECRVGFSSAGPPTGS